MTNVSNLSDRQLLETIYALLIHLLHKVESSEENANDFMMNVIANVFADKMINDGTKKK